MQVFVLGCGQGEVGRRSDDTPVEGVPGGGGGVGSVFVMARTWCGPSFGSDVKWGLPGLVCSSAIVVAFGGCVQMFR